VDAAQLFEESFVIKKRWVHDTTVLGDVSEALAVRTTRSAHPPCVQPPQGAAQ
jgi:hypothetical protein